MRLICCLLALLTGSSVAFATHISGGYIRVTPIAGQALTCQITVTMYYNVLAGGAAAEAANDLYVCFGDNGNAQLVKRTRVQVVAIDQGSLSISEYTTTHTYSGPATYSIQATAIYRNDYVRNIGGGSAAQQAFSVRTITQIGTGLYNRTPALSLPVTGLVVSLNQRALLVMGASDADGDSLAFSLAFPLTSPAPDGTLPDLCSRFTTLSTYRFPNEINQKGTYRLNTRTGLLTWDVPTEQGQYSVAILVSEWRNGVMISQTQQELLLTVIDRGGVPVAPPAYEPAQPALVTAIPDVDATGLSLKISPNPVAENVVQADLLMSHSQPVTIELIDSQGRVYNTVRVDQPSRRHRQSFDLVGKPAGLYLIRAESGGKQVVQKVLKQ